MLGEKTLFTFGEEVVFVFQQHRVVLTFIVLFLMIAFVFILFVIFPHLCIQKMFFRTIVKVAQECFMQATVSVTSALLNKVAFRL